MRTAGTLLIIIAVLFFVQGAIYPTQMNDYSMQSISSINGKLELIKDIAIIQVFLLLISGLFFIDAAKKTEKVVEIIETHINDLYKKIESEKNTTS